MRRLLPLSALVLAGALALSACDVSVTPYAAKVDGSTISSATLDGALAAVGNDAGLRCELAAENSSSNGGAAAIEGAGKGTYDAEFVASQLTALIKQKALAREVAALSIRVTPAASTLAYERLASELNPVAGSNCTASGLTVLAELSPSYERVLVSIEADQDAIAAHLAGTTLSTSGLQRYAAAHPDATSIACVEAILTSKLAAAKSARAAIVGGAKFATVAKQESIDQGSAPNGGALGCLPLSEFASPLDTDLAALPTGQLSQPIAFQGNYVLLEITVRKAPTSAQTLDAMTSAVQAAETTLVNHVLGREQVSVDPRYGAWRFASGSWQVNPPSGPVNADLADPTALTPTPVSLG